MELGQDPEIGTGIRCLQSSTNEKKSGRTLQGQDSVLDLLVSKCAGTDLKNTGLTGEQSVRIRIEDNVKHIVSQRYVSVKKVRKTETGM